MKLSGRNGAVHNARHREIESIRKPFAFGGDVNFESCLLGRFQEGDSLNQNLRLLICAFALLACAANPALAQTSKSANPPPGPIRVKVVVVAMFEVGEDTGDTPGEYQLWVEREHLDQVLPLPAGYHHVRMNKGGVLGMLTGVATAKAAASVMAVGLDPRFDLTRAYWVIAGIGGGDPADVSLGSAVWANHVIDGDIGYEIDARQIPADWPTGFVPLRRKTPYEQPLAELEGQM